VFPAFEDQTGVDGQVKASIYLTSEFQLVVSYTPFTGVEEYYIPYSFAYYLVFPYKVIKFKSKQEIACQKTPLIVLSFVDRASQCIIDRIHVNYSLPPGENPTADDDDDNNNNNNNNNNNYYYYYCHHYISIVKPTRCTFY
jgi:hypothetical protein